MLPSDQRRMTRQSYFLLEKALEKQTEAIWDQENKQIKLIEEHGRQWDKK